ncbi:hypothetical protein B566_EDAN015015 [Ephemera danica]|nr:hypothetical protein B566_EDAN015015 [Ephemera danica]
MASRSSFVVGTINGKSVAYIVDKCQAQNRSRASGTSRTSTAPQRSPCNVSCSIDQNELKEAARINGSVTLTQQQLQELLTLLDRNTGAPPKVHEAWLSSASSCGFSGGESSCDISAPATPGPVTVRDPISVEVQYSPSQLQRFIASPKVATLKAAFTHPESCDCLTCQVPTRDQGLYCPRENEPSEDNERNSCKTVQQGISRDSESDFTCVNQTGMKPPPSLLEQKKLQWAKERAELEGLCSPWGRSSHHETTRNSHQNKSYQVENVSSSSLPIIVQENAVSPAGFISEYEWRNGAQSVGYFNENSMTQSLYVSPSYTRHSEHTNFNGSRNHLDIPSPVGGVSSADDSGFSVGSKSVRFTARTPGEGEEHAEEGRPRWGDKGVGVGHLWEPSTEPTARLPDPQSTAISPGAYPSWLEKGLSRMETSPVPSEKRNFLRGQNVPLDPEEMEEREKKRQKALELQKAIKQQLEERDRKRREEKERRLCEDRREEERVRREQELERARLDQERRKELAAKEAKEARIADASKQNQKRATKGTKTSREADKPINLSPRIVDVSQRQKQGDFGWEEMNLPRAMHDLHISIGEAKSRQERETGMMMVGQEVAVLLAPELEERLLHSRAARDQATQTETSSQQPNREHLKCRKPRQSRILTERPQWGAHRSNKRYIKQSDKDVYRQRGASVGATSTPPRQPQTQSRHHSLSEKHGLQEGGRNAVESTEESDRSPTVCLSRRKMGHYKESQFQQCNSSDDDSPSPTHRNSQAWGSRRVQVWSNPSKNLAPPPLHPPASILDLQEPVDYFDAIFNPPLRTTNSPPVPAVAKMIEKQPDLYHQPHRRELSRRPLQSPPVPTVARKLQEAETTASQLPSITDAGNKSAPPTLQGHSSGLLPNIQSHEGAVLPSADILSQLSTLRKALQTKQNEWEMRSSTPYSDS